MGAVLEEAWPFGLAVIGIAVAFTVGCFLSSAFPDAVRYAGTMLQLLGLATVAIGLGKTRRLFRQPSLMARVLGWFARLTAAFTAPRSISAEAAAGGYAIVGAEAGLIHGAGPGASVEQRLSILEENVNRLRDELDTKVQGLRQELAGVKETVQRESWERKAEYRETRRMIEDATIGGLHFEIVGLFWLTLGVTGTSVPEEVAAAICGLSLKYACIGPF